MNDYKCQKCGICCTSFTIILDVNKSIGLKSFILNNIKNLFGINLKEKLGPTEVTQHGYCEYLDEKTGLCSIHDKRENICKTANYLCFRDAIPVNFIRMIRRINKIANGDPQKTSEIINDILIHYDKKLSEMDKNGTFCDSNYIS